MRNALPQRPLKNESAIINLDDKNNPGTHWVAYRKNGSNVIYFDSFGNINPPKELVEYFTNCNIKYTRERFQKFSQTNCGLLCIEFLKSSLV